MCQGLATALFLHKGGINSVIVLESRPSNYQDKGYYVISPNGESVLQGLGVYETVRSQGFAFDGPILADSYKRPIFAGGQSSVDLFGYQHIFVARGIVHKALKEKAAQAGLNIVYDARCKRVLEGDKSKVECTDGRVFHGNFIIGADGIKSAVRTAIGEASELVYAGFMGVNTGIELKALDTTTAEIAPGYLFLGRDALCHFIPIGQERAAVWASFEHPDMTTEEWEKLVNDRERIGGLIDKVYQNDRWSSLIQEAWKKAERHNDVIWPYVPTVSSTSANAKMSHRYHYLKRLSRWTNDQGTIAVIGDAAHGMPPTSGQGASVALEDAEGIAYLISLRQQHPEKYLPLLKEWEKHRIQRMDKLRAETEQFTNMIKPCGPVFEYCRKWLIWLMLTLTGPKRSPKAWQWTYRFEKDCPVYQAVEA